MRLLAALAWIQVLPGCGEEGSSGSARCDPERRATFDSLPSGPLPETSLDGVRVQLLFGEVEVGRTMGGPATILFIGGGAKFLPDCRADEVEVILDDSQGPLTVDLRPGEYGDAFVSASTSSLSAVPVDEVFVRAVAKRGEDDPPIGRADLSGGMSGSGALSVALREIAFRTFTDE